MQHIRLSAINKFLYKHRVVLVISISSLIIVGLLAVVIAKERAITSEPREIINELTANNVLDKPLYIDPISNAALQAAAWQTDSPEDAKSMAMLAALPSAQWIVVEQDIPLMESTLSASAAQGTIPLFVIYMIPNRDCGLYSAGGAASSEVYIRSIKSIAEAIDEKDAIIVLEPDAVAQATQSVESNDGCMTKRQVEERFAMLDQSVDIFKQNKNTHLYIDAGNSSWNNKTIDAMAENLKLSGVLKADGFATNVSNFNTTQDETAYGESLSRELNNAHFVIDTSRNGVGPYINNILPAYSWCNPPGRAVGHYPTHNTGNDKIDALLHVKNIGESDGSDPDPQKCFGGPQAGKWWPEYALGLVQRWPQNLQP